MHALPFLNASWASAHEMRSKLLYNVMLPALLLFVECGYKTSSLRICAHKQNCTSLPNKHGHWSCIHDAASGHHTMLSPVAVTELVQRRHCSHTDFAVMYPICPDVVVMNQQPCALQLQVRKSELEKRKNDDEQEEGWVACDACGAWVHMICGMFNKGRNDDNIPYHCPNCLYTGWHSDHALLAHTRWSTLY